MNSCNSGASRKPQFNLQLAGKDDWKCRLHGAVAVPLLGSVLIWQCYLNAYFGVDSAISLAISNSVPGYLPLALIVVAIVQYRLIKKSGCELAELGVRNACVTITTDAADLSLYLLGYIIVSVKNKAYISVRPWVELGLEQTFKFDLKHLGYFYPDFSGTLTRLQTGLIKMWPADSFSDFIRIKVKWARAFCGGQVRLGAWGASPTQRFIEFDDEGHIRRIYCGCRGKLPFDQPGAVVTCLSVKSVLTLLAFDSAQLLGAEDIKFGVNTLLIPHTDLSRDEHDYMLFLEKMFEKLWDMEFGTKETDDVPVMFL